MKWVRVTALILAMATLLAACSAAQQDRTATAPAPAERRILIVYLSRTRNTEAIAKYIQAELVADLVALELEKPYPADYRTTVEQVARENDSGLLPPLKKKIENIVQYDTVFVGFPTWGMQMPPPMRSFLKQYDLNGKTVAPFNTHAGYAVGSGFEEVKKLAPKSTVLEGLSVKGGIERDGVLFVMEGNKEKEAKAQVNAWLAKIGLIARR